MFSHIVWSDKSCTLREFVDEYPLPQLIKVESGVYNDDDARTLSAEQILTLHVTKRADKVLVRAATNKRYFLPITCPHKVEILPKICQDTYYSVEDITNSSIAPDFKFIRVVHNGPPSLRIRAGDILKIKNTDEENRVKYLECEFYNKTQDSVMLPLDFKAAFEPLASPEEHLLQEVLNSYTLPVRVKFTSNTIIQDTANNNIELQSLGSVLLKEIREETTIIATSRDDETVTVLMIPSDLDVKVNPALGAVIGDSKYARFCKKVHDGTELSKIDLLDTGSKLLEFSEEPTVNVVDVYDYVEIGPPLPPRSDSKQSEQPDSDEDYEDVDLPPPRPPKPPPKPNLKPAYQKKKTDDVYPSMYPRPYSSEEPSPRDNRGDDDDDDDEYEEYDHEVWSTDDEDEVYPETDLPGVEMPGNRRKGECNSSEEPVKPNLKTRVSALLKKAMAKSPTFPPSLRPPSATYANVPTKRLSPPSQPQSPVKSLSFSPPSVAQGYPMDLSSLSVSEVGECLEKLNLGEHVEAFESHTVDGNLLENLSEQELIELGVIKSFQRNKLLHFIQGWRPKMN